MQIALDGIPLAFPKTGVGHYTFELAHALACVAPGIEFELLYPSTFPPLEQNRRSTPRNLKFVRVEVGPLARHWWSVGLPRYLRRRHLDLFHGTNYDVPLWRRCATVLTVHDLSLLLHPATHLKRSVRRARRRLPLMVKTADGVICCAESVRSEIVETLGHAAKIKVVPEGVRKCFSPMPFEETAGLRQRLGVGDRFVLAVGTIEPRKNLQLVIKAFEVVAQQPMLADLQLVIAGGRGWLSGPLFDLIARSPVRDRIVLTDYLVDDELRSLYSSCRLFIYPSLYEGFGLPPLEAMACGAAVIVSRIPVLLETTGHAARSTDPQNVSDLVANMTELLTDDNERQRLVGAGLLRVKEFSWEKTARETLKVYEEVLNKVREPDPSHFTRKT